MSNPYLKGDEKFSFSGWARNIVHKPGHQPVEISHTVVVEDFAEGVGLVGMIIEATKNLAILIPKKSKDLDLFRFDRKIVDRKFHHITVYYVDF